MDLVGIFGLFSPCSEYFTYCSPDGCLRIWDTSSDCLKQEYTPSSHLSSSSTCIAWGPSSSSLDPKRKKSKKSKSNETVTAIADLKLIAMGTLSGDVLLYSVTKGDLHLHMRSGHTDVVNDVCWHAETDSIFSCSSDRHIVRWKISNGKVYEKWKADKGAIHSVCVIDENSIISASSEIKWWDLAKKTVIKKFSGHGSEVFRLLTIKQPLENSTGQYFISAAVGDRTISAWRLKDDGDCSAVASFAVTDDPCSLSLTNTSAKDQPISLSVITKTGNLHIFEHQLNGRCRKPLLPKVTFHIATSNASYEKPQPVPVLAAQISSSGELCQMAYGNFLKPVFESIELQDCEKELFLVRDVLTDCYSSLEKSVSKVKEPSKDGDIKHLAPGFMTPTRPSEIPHRKRKRLSKEAELPMEERLNALYLDKTSEDVQPTAKSDSVIHLLLQGLQSQDQKLLNTALQCGKEAVIRNSVQRLPLTTIPLLLKELHKRLTKREPRNHPCLRWLKVLLENHVPYMMTCQDIDEHLGPLSQLFVAETQNYQKISALNRTLRSMLHEVASRQEENESQTNTEALVTYREDSSEDEMRVSDREETMEAESEKSDCEGESEILSDSSSNEA